MIIGQLFFMREDEEWQIKNLTKALYDAKFSAGAGLSISYFYNYIKPTVERLNENAVFKIKDVEYKAKKGIIFEIYIPRKLLDEDSIRKFVMQLKDEKIVVEGE